MEQQAREREAGPRRHGAAALLAALVVLAMGWWAAPTPAAGATDGGGWLRRGPTGGARAPLLTTPADPMRIFATGGATLDELFASEDGGASWLPLPGAPPGRTQAVAVDAVDPTQLWAVVLLGAGGDGGLALASSGDGGGSWQLVAEDSAVLRTLPPTYVASMVAGRGASSGTTLALASRAGLLRSVDRGRTWQRARGVVSPDELQFGARLLADPRRPGRLYLKPAGTNRLYTSADDGLRWRSMRRGLPADLSSVRELAVEPASGQLLLTASRVGNQTWVFRSTAPDKAWQASPRLPRSLSFVFALAPLGPGRWRALGSTAAGVVLVGSADGGVSWQRLDRPTPPGLNLQVAGGRLLSVAADGIHRSDDDGASWQQARPDVAAQALLSVGFDPRGVPAIFAQVGDGTVRSLDGGLTWRRVELPAGEVLLAGPPQPVAGRPRQLVSFAARPIRTLECPLAGVAASRDRGASWSITAPFEGGTPKALAVSPTDPDLLFASFAQFSWRLSCPTLCRLARSQDRGASLACLDDALRAVLPTNLLGPNVDQLAFAVDGGSVVVRADGQWLASVDDGDHWQPTAEPAVTILARGADGTFRVYGRRGDEMVRSVDGGVSWQALAPLPVVGSLVALAVDSADPDRLGAITGRDVLLSDDAGDSWQDVSGDLPATVRQLTAVGILRLPRPTLLVGTDGASGLLALPLPAPAGFQR